MTEHVLLGDEAVALGAIHAGISAAFAYPGTPSTEIVETLRALHEQHAGPPATWAVNEKTAFEQALGVSFAGRRALVAMKHVGLNVAADAFMNAALVAPHGGLVLAVADDPGMHSSQNEQDSRYYAHFARIPCFEPADQQQAYDMTREAFDLSERLRVPVMLRLVTRLAHARSVVQAGEPRAENPMQRPPRRSSWILLPGNARAGWHELLGKQAAMAALSEASPWNTLTPGDADSRLGVITTGIARNYFLEAATDLPLRPWHLHLGLQPAPRGLVGELTRHVDRLLVLEDGYPFVEERLRGLLPQSVVVQGRQSGELPEDGELGPDRVRAALGLTPRPHPTLEGLKLPARPPQLCAGCPHRDSYDALHAALAGYPDAVVTADIGCYTLGAMPPYSAIESCVCMGASIGMARGAALAGQHPAVAVIGDSTFLHSGITSLIDVIAEQADITLLILDNQAVAMTGGQQTALPSARLVELVRGLGIDPAHLHVLPASRRHVDEDAAVIRAELEHHGPSVIILQRECIEAARDRKRAAHAPASNASPAPAAAKGVTP